MSSSVAGPDCCGGFGNVDFRQADLCVMTRLLGYVDPSDPCFVAAILTITFNPLFWNVVARWEQRTRKLSKVFRSPYLACYSLGAAILLLNVLRSHCFTQAMLSQPKMESLDNPTAYRVGLALLGIGSTFVLSSFFALGFTGTFLAWEAGLSYLIQLVGRQARWDFCWLHLGPKPGLVRVWIGRLGPRGSAGCSGEPAALKELVFTGGRDLRERRVQEACAKARPGPVGHLWQHASPTGLLLTVVVALIYMVAIQYEEPFTDQIYQQKASSSRKRS
ncbi:phosphatidylethanolamine N-methyltransferase [Puma concolor]|uniref:Phosphatidylethanolamine N-methyltransferase n=1 Tax=Puma concolor TaxID=9696 RepID=A0A6P6HL99_PUMCO|nr:phosphatidylethanolamine N-methyltransferase [Puma concolor]